MEFVSDANQTGREGKETGCSQKDTRTKKSKPDKLTQQLRSSACGSAILSLKHRADRTGDFEGSDRH